MNLLKKLYRDDDGQVTILFAVMLIALLGVAALSIDGGRVYHTYNEAVNIAELAAHAGAKDFDKGLDVASNTAYEYAQLNGATKEQTDVVISDTPKDTIIQVTITLQSKMIFGTLFGIQDKQVVGIYAVSQQEHEDIAPPPTITEEEQTAINNFINIVTPMSPEIPRNQLLRDARQARDIWDTLSEVAQNEVDESLVEKLIDVERFLGIK